MRRLYVLVVMLLALTLSGCLGTQSKVLAKPMASAHPGAHAVTIDRAPWHGTSPDTIFVDYKQAATIYGGQSITLYLPEGPHVIGVRSLGQDPNKRTDQVRINVGEAGVTLHVRFFQGAAEISHSSD